MPTWAVALSVFGFMVAYKMLSNVVYLLSVKRYYTLYMDFLANDKIDISLHQASIEKLFKRAGFGVKIPIVRPMGFGQLASFSVTAVQHIENRREDIVFANAHSFKQSISVYSMLVKESISPLYWGECIIFLPQKLFQYLGAGNDSALVKISQILYWFLAPVLLFFREQIHGWVVGLLK